MSVTTTILGADAPDTAIHSEPSVTGAPSTVPEEPPKDLPFDFKSMIGENGAFNENWKNGLPESIRNEKCLDNIKTIGTLAQSYVHAQKAMGANKVAIPGENATPEEWNAFYKACGRPDEESGYKHDAVKLPEGIVLDDEQVAKFRKFAFEHGMSQKIFEAALAYDVQRFQEQRAAAEKAKDAEYDQTIAKLQQEFGAKFEETVAQCNKAMETFGLTEVLREKGLLNNYTIIKALAGIGSKISESKLKGDEGAPVPGDPQTKLDEIRNNPEDPFYKREHPAHHSRVAEVNSLLAALANAKKK